MQNMKILVCVKQVPEAEAEISIDANGQWITVGGAAEYRMNRCDECAVEEAVRVKEACPDTVIDALTMGPERAEAVVRRAMGMGADNGAHILTEKDDYVDAFTTARAIAGYAREKHYDLVMTGAMSEDLMQGQVGALVAAHLNMACISSTILTELAADQKSVYVEREVEGGSREVGDIHLPALLAIQTGINTPRYASLKGIMSAKKKEIKALGLADLGLDAGEVASRMKTIGLAPPPKGKGAEMIEGSPDEVAQELLKRIRENTGVI